MSEQIDSRADLEVTDRTRLNRRAQRGDHSRTTVHAILDEGLVAHVAVAGGERPMCIPMIYARLGDDLYLHGAVGNQVLRQLAGGAEACVEVTLIDGLVMARSAFHHSVNYRSVMIFGRPRPLEDREEKNEALRVIVEHIARGRWDDVRAPTEAELMATTVLALPIVEASAKVRSGPPVDDEADYALSAWAGVIPLSVAAGAPEADPRLDAAVPAPSYAIEYSR